VVWPCWPGHGVVVCRSSRAVSCISLSFDSCRFSSGFGIIGVEPSGSATVVFPIYITKRHKELLSWYSDELRAGRPGFDSRQVQKPFFLHSVQNGSGAHPASYSMGTGALSLELKRHGSELITHLHPVPGSRMVELYLHSSVHLQSAVLN
jgi:hypothetical protein